MIRDQSPLRRGFPTSGFPVQSEDGESTLLLAAGVYWYDGNALADGKTPHTGQGWTLTTALSNGAAGDTTTRVTSTGASISVLHVESAYDIGSWDHTFKWLGGIETLYSEWDGSAWDALSTISPAPLPHGAYTDEQFTSLLDGAASLTTHVVVATSDDITGSSFMSCSDSRPSA